MLPQDQWGLEPLPLSQAFPARLESPHPKASKFPALAWPAQLESTSGRGQFLPGVRDLSEHMTASACIVSV